MTTRSKPAGTAENRSDSPAEERSEIAETYTDKIDDDIDEHVQHFIKDFPNGLRIEKLSLKTAEEAQAALALLDSIQQKIQEKQHAAEILRSLLRNRG